MANTNEKKPRKTGFLYLFGFVCVAGGLNSLNEYLTVGYIINHKEHLKAEGKELLVQSCVMLFVGLMFLAFAIWYSFKNRKANRNLN